MKGTTYYTTKCATCGASPALESCLHHKRNLDIGRLVPYLIVLVVFSAWPIYIFSTVQFVPDPSIEAGWREARGRNCRAMAYRLANTVSGKYFTTGPVERAYEACLR